MARAAKHITKEMCLSAMANTRSVKAAARYLNCSYQHLKPYMKMYKDENGKTLFEAHKNQSGKGIHKNVKGGKKIILKELMDGTVDPANFDPHKLKYKLFEEGYLKEECSHCGFKERRVIDYKVPLMLHFKDGNKSNYRSNNLAIYCYNCYFLVIGNIFNKKEMVSLEYPNDDYNNVSKAVDWEMDDYHIQRLKEIGIWEEDRDESEDPYSLVSRQ